MFSSEHKDRSLPSGLAFEILPNLTYQNAHRPPLPRASLNSVVHCSEGNLALEMANIWQVVVTAPPVLRRRHSWPRPSVLMGLTQHPSEAAVSGSRHPMKCLEAQLELNLRRVLFVFPASLSLPWLMPFPLPGCPGFSLFPAPSIKTPSSFRGPARRSAPPWERPRFPVVIPVPPFPALMDPPLWSLLLLKLSSLRYQSALLCQSLGAEAVPCLPIDPLQSPEECGSF